MNKAVMAFLLGAGVATSAALTASAINSNDVSHVNFVCGDGRNGFTIEDGKINGKTINYAHFDGEAYTYQTGKIRYTVSRWHGGSTPYIAIINNDFGNREACFRS